MDEPHLSAIESVDEDVERPGHRRDRSNVALLHVGQSTDPDLTLRLTVYSGDPANPVKEPLPDVTLKAGEFRQINNVLVSNGLNVSQGFVKVERVGTAAAPCYAYAVINDQTTSDGSFILPSYYKSQIAVSRFTLPATDPALGGGFFMSGRTAIAGDGGSYGLHYPAVPEGQTARTSAWLYGLQQNNENRTNLALINTGEGGDSDDVFSIEIYDGVLANKVRTLEGIVVKARRWIQLNAVLREAPGTLQGYARVIRTGGTNPFIAHAVTNDGAAAGQRSGDGAYIAMQGAD